MDKIFPSDGNDMGSIPILNTNFIMFFLLIGGLFMNLLEQIKSEKELLDNKQRDITQLEEECVIGKERIAQLENEYNRMGVFKINDLGVILAHIVSEIENKYYLYQTVEYCDYSWCKHTSWRPKKGMICAIVEDTYKDCCFKIDDSIEKDPVIVAKMVCFLGGKSLECKRTECVLGDTEKNFVGFFKNSAFPYLDDFVDKLVVYRYDKDNQMMDHEEILNLANDFIASKKDVDDNARVIKKVVT